MNRKTNVTVDEILDAIMLQESEPNHQALVNWCNQYPDHRDAIVEFFATWAVEQESVEHSVIDEARVASRMVSHAMNLLHHQPVPNAAKKSEEARLFKMIESSGKTEDSFMTDCSLDETLIAKLDRHLILFGTIPQRCITKLSLALHCAAEEVARALAGNPIRLANYKAKGKPVVSQETFIEAVASSQLSDEAKKEWERIVKSEPPPIGNV